jgi:pimeloyl-ACP methyl ester carboxylesterase
MKTVHWKSILILAISIGIPTLGQNKNQGTKQRDDLKKPLVIASQGSFFVGGESKTLSPTPGPGISAGGGEVTVNQMYVQYQIPPDGDRHIPVVMVHGCCLSSKTWETTPDGRMGWNEYFVRRGRPVYLADQASRARSGFDGSTINAVRAGSVPPAQLPNILMASHQTAWTVFRFGPTFGQAFPDGQFPIEAVEELYKQMIPDLNSTLPMPNPTWKNMAALAVKLKGAVLMGHSESGFFPEQAALIDATDIRGMISIEMPCASMNASQISTLSKIPVLVMFGDHLADVQGGGPANWSASFEGCQKFIQQVKDAGGDAEMMYLPKLGIKGNSHMLMQDRNNLDLADLLLAWIDNHVESKQASKGAKR